MITYQGKAFREAHGLGLRAMARDLHIPHATLFALEHNTRDCINRRLVGRIVAYFQARGIACEVGDLLVYAPDPDPPL